MTPIPVDRSNHLSGQIMQDVLLVSGEEDVKELEMSSVKKKRKYKINKHKRKKRMRRDRHKR